MDKKAFSVKGIHHVNLEAASLERTLRFYKDGLGLAASMYFQMDGAPAAMIDLGGCAIEVFQRALPGPQVSPRWPHLALRVDNVDAAFESALQAGGKALLSPRDILLCEEPPCPARIAFVAGPDGEELELFCEK